VLKGLNAWALVSEKFTCKVKHSITYSILWIIYKGRARSGKLNLGWSFA